ncbi:MAG TPA: hypothetical protein VMA13_06790 [Candidatus Saccharimonadales bacterium]|nr:hypothetical protein [Candidatus Saccharimonadales bacterium]
MEVEFNVGLTGNNPVSQTPVRRVPSQPASNTMSFQYTQALEQTLKETPTVRPDAVSRAAALLSDPNYPSDETLDRVAGVLARNIQNTPGS